MLELHCFKIINQCNVLSLLTVVIVGFLFKKNKLLYANTAQSFLKNTQTIIICI